MTKLIQVTNSRNPLTSEGVGWGKGGQGLVEVGAIGRIKREAYGGIDVEFDKSQPHVSDGATLDNFYLLDGEYEVLDYKQVGLSPRVGDYVVFTKLDDCFGTSETERLTIGKFYRVVRLDSIDDAQIIDDHGKEFDTCNVNIDVFRVGEEEETEEVTTFAEGDRVTIDVPEGVLPKHGWGEAHNGEEGVVFGHLYGSVLVDIPSQDVWLASPSEIKNIEENEEEEESKITEKFYVGDIIRINDYQFGLHEDALAEVTSVHGGTVVTKGVKDGQLSDVYLADEECIELVAPAEARADV